MTRPAALACSACLMTACLLSINQVSAQVNTADILGTVSDPAGAVVPGVKVTAQNTATNEVKIATTTETGDYVFNLMMPGQYTITAEAPSFRKAAVNLSVSAGDRARANIQLQVGDVTQVVEVAAQSPALQTDSATLSTVVAAQSVQDLPLNGRNFVTLVQSTVGVAAGPSNSILSGTRPDERRQTANVVANGQNETFNNQMIDGMDNNEREQFTLMIRPSIDMIQEIKVDTNSYPAEVGRAGGAVVNLLTKSGTNEFHGGLYEFLRNDKLNANDFFANLTGVPRPKYRQNQFGGSIGGPIRKNKTFFFGDVEALRIRQGVPTGLIFTPTQFEEQNPGNFSDVGGPILPASQLDPVALKYWKLFPAPNAGTPGVLGANYLANVNKLYNSTTYDARIDHRFSDKDSIFGRFSYNPTFNSQPALFPDVTVDGLKVSAGGGIFPGPSEADAQGYMADYVHVVRPTVVTEFKAAYTRLWLYTSAPNQGTNASQKFGMPNTDVSDQISGLATIDIVPMRAVGSSFTIGDDRFVPILDINNVFQEQGSVIWTRGTHNMKFGGGMIRRQLNYYQNTFGLGYFRFTQSELIDLQNLLLGKPDEIQRQVNPKRQYFRFWEPNIYVQDDWHAKSWLTLNIGLRWDYFSPITAAQGERSNFDPVLAQTCATNPSCNPFRVGATAGVKSYWTNFEPRFGFAATPRAGFVVRGGFGMSRFAQDYASGSMNLYNPPFIPLNLDCFPTTGTGASACPTGTGLLFQGAPPVTIPTINNQLPGTVGAHAVDYPQAYIMQWNLTFQKQVGANVVSASYVGQVGRHLQYAPNINIPPPSQAGLGVYNPRVFASLMPNLASINYYSATGASEYNAAQFRFERRYAKGLTANANYTFARNLTNISDGGAAVGSILPNNRSYDWGNSDIYVRHRFVVRLTYELPFGKSGSRFTKFATGGWEANLLGFYQSGVPFTVLDTATPVPSNVSNLVTADRPNVVPGVSFVPDHQSYTNWINVNAFTPQPVGTVGNEARTSLYGPNQRSMDFSLFKDFPIRERMKLQFRAEVYNITNTENFGQPNLNITKWTSTLPGVGTGAPGATPILGAGGFGQITGSNLAAYPRQYQFALKLIF
jgi:hypothetical protein